MAAPNYTTRVTPVGRKLGDGYQSLLTCAADPDVSFWEKSVKPPGLDGGDAVDNTTMHNVTWRTTSSRGLRTATQAQMTAAYDPRVYDQIVALINLETTWTVLFSDGSQVAFYGFLKSFETGDMVEGTMPEATIVIVPTNTDPASGVEAGMNYNAGGLGT